VILGSTGSAIADSPNPEWPSSNTSLGFTDDIDFNFISAESTTADHNEFHPIVAYLVDREWGDKTDLVDRDLGRDTTPSTWIDVYWYMTPQSSFNNAAVAADTICRRWRNQSSRICDQNRVRFVEKLLTREAPSHTATQLWNTICHEFGHAVGFGHGTSVRSCMDGGNNGIISWYEIQRVNGRF